MALRLRKNFAIKYLPQLMMKRNHGTASDYTNTMCGKREYVCYGFNGSPNYADIITYPMPAIRFREPDAAICALRQKEKDDWKKLSKQDIKTLYRYSFCQTMAEFTAPTGDWKRVVGLTLWACAVAIVYTCAVNAYHHELPETFQEDRRQAQLKRMIALQVGPIEGLSSNWDYEVGDWKQNVK